MSATPGRFHYMDNLRALAMLSGVLFHAALAYSPLAHADVPTADRGQSEAVDACLWFLHLFRMPLFFVVAGFFAALLVDRRGLAGLFRNRLRRIALPFVVFWPLVYYALDYSTMHAAMNVQHPSPLLALIRQYAQGTGVPAHMPTTAHLWFLYYLMFFYVLVWAATNFSLAPLGRFLRGLGPAWLLGAMPLMLVPALASVTAPAPAPESFLPQFWAFGYYGPFFVFGYLLFGHEAAIGQLRPLAPWLLAASLLLYGGFWLLLHRQPANAWLMALAEAYIGAWATGACLIGARSLLDRGNAVLRYFSEASYWIYVVHLPVLFAIQYWLMDVDLPWPAKFGFSVLATVGVCLIGYHAVVRRTVVGGFMGVRGAVAT